MIRILGLAVALSVLPLTNALAEPPPQPQAPGARTDAQLVAIFDRWFTEEQAGRMTREQVLAEARALPQEEMRRMRPAVAARDAAAVAAAERSVAAAERSAAEATRAREASEEEARRAQEEARRAQEDLRRANEAVQRALGGPRS